MQRFFDRRLDELQDRLARLGADSRGYCDCGRIEALMELHEMFWLDPPEIICTADEHRIRDKSTYRFRPSDNVDIYERLLGSLPEPTIDTSDSYYVHPNGSIAKAASHPGIIYPNRRDDEPPPREVIVKSETDDKQLEKVKPPPPEVDPIKLAIAEKVKKLRPAGLGPEDDRGDPERWLKLGEEI